MAIHSPVLPDPAAAHAVPRAAKDVVREDRQRNAVGCGVQTDCAVCGQCDFVGDVRGRLLLAVP